MTATEANVVLQNSVVWIIILAIFIVFWVKAREILLWCVVAVLFTGILIGISYLDWEGMKERSWVKQSKIEPRKYGVCIVCLKVKPHKKMYALGNDKWKCEECY